MKFFILFMCKNKMTFFIFFECILSDFRFITKIRLCNISFVKKKKKNSLSQENPTKIQIKSVSF